jgi:hypothetical protein
LRLATQHGSPSGSVTAEHLRAVDSLLTAWRGQGPTDLPGGVRAHRRNDRMWLAGGAAG